MIVISSGWGVQSMCMQGMVAFGELEPITAAIHADTGHERQATYEFAARWTPWLEDHGVHIVTVSNPTPRPGSATEISLRVLSISQCPGMARDEDGKRYGLAGGGTGG